MKMQMISQGILLNFIAQCPASKRGRPMSVGNAMRMEKAAPGSVCAKESRARDGKGLRQVFYKMKAGSKSAQPSTSDYDQPQQKKSAPNPYTAKLKALEERRKDPAVDKQIQKQPPKAVNKPQNTGDTEKGTSPNLTRKRESKQSLADYPTFKSNIEGTSESQTVWGKAFHHSIERQLRSYLVGLSGQKPELQEYAHEAWTNLTKIDKAGVAFGLKGLNGEGLFWSLLSPESAKIVALKVKKNLADPHLGSVFLRVMKGKFKDDSTYQDAVSHSRIWPIPIWPTSVKSGVAEKTAKPQGKVARLVGKVKGSKLVGKAKVALDKAKVKATEAKQKADEWSKNHPVLSWLAKTGAKAGLGALTGLMQKQATTKNMIQRLDEVDRVLKFYAQCPASKRGRPMNVANAVKAEKASPGSVCAKEAKARSGRGERTIFYRNKSGNQAPAQKPEDKPEDKADGKIEASFDIGEKHYKKLVTMNRHDRFSAMTRLSVPILQKVYQQAVLARYKARAGFAGPNYEAGDIEHKAQLFLEHKGISQTTIFASAKEILAKNNLLPSNVNGSAKSDAKHEQRHPPSGFTETNQKLARKMDGVRQYWKDIPGFEAALKKYYEIADNPKARGLQQKLSQLSHWDLFLSLLPAEHIKELAKRTPFSILGGSIKRPPVFMELMKAKFKDDPSFQDALATGERWPPTVR